MVKAEFTNIAGHVWQKSFASARAFTKYRTDMVFYIASCVKVPA